MPIAWNDDEILNFFGTLPEPSNVEGQSERISFIDYLGKTLRYSIWLHCDDELVTISGDILHPFGADAMYEIAIPCDAINEILDAYYPGKKGLGFWYGNTKQKHNMTMMLLKRPDGDLKVWPSSVWPDRHAYHRRLSSELPGKRYDPSQ